MIEISERIAALAGRELSVAHPIVDARMPDGSRVNAVIPPVGGPYLSIRKFNRLRLDLVPGGRHGRDWVTEGGLIGRDGRLPRRASSGPRRTSSSPARPAPARRRSCARSPTCSIRPSGSASSRTRPSWPSRTPIGSTSRRSTRTISPTGEAELAPARCRRSRRERPADAARPSDRRRDPPAQGGLLHAPGAPHRARRVGDDDPRELGRGCPLPASSSSPASRCAT